MNMSDSDDENDKKIDKEQLKMIEKNDIKTDRRDKKKKRME